MPPLIGKRAGFLAADSAPGEPVSAQVSRQTERQARGAEAEQCALDYLLKHGLKLLGRNIRYRAGEIDLIMQDGALLVFVEVRQRSGAGWGGALASIDAGKQRRLIRAAELYLQRSHGNCPPPCRFDVVVLEGTERIHWVRDAFST